MILVKFRAHIQVVKLLGVVTLISGLMLSANSLPAHAAGSYDNARLADKALTYVDQGGGNACRDARTVGDGNCKAFVNCIVWMVSGGSQWPAPGYHSGFQGAGGVEVSGANASKGDIIQVGNSDSDWPLHTAIIVKNLGGGRFDVVDSNFSDNRDQMVRHHVYDPPAGARFWRMGKKISPPPEKWHGVGDAKFLGQDRLTAGQRMHGGKYILSGNGQHALVMQRDGNLVLYGHGQATWDSGTAGHDGASLVVQDDGNIVIYHDGKDLWSTRTAGTDVNRLVMQGDGNLVAYTSGGSDKWASNTVEDRNLRFYGSDKLTTGQRLSAGQYIRSADKRYALLMQRDGNLVLYGPGYHVLWSSRTGGQGSAESYLGVQGDGNVVVYKCGGCGALWDTGQKSIAYFKVQNDGNLVGYTSSGKARWASNTAGKI